MRKIKQQYQDCNIGPGRRLVFTGFRGGSGVVFAHFVIEKQGLEFFNIDPLRVRLDRGYPNSQSARRVAERFARRVILRQQQRAA